MRRTLTYRWVCLGLLFLSGLLAFFTRLAPAVAIFTPANLRSQVTAAFLFAFSMIGASGPVLVGLITDYVLRDEHKIGVSMGLVVAAMVALSITLLRISLPACAPS